MNKNLARQWLALIILASFGVAAVGGADPQPGTQGQAAGGPAASAAAPAARQENKDSPGSSGDSNIPPPRATAILGLCDDKGNEIDGKDTSRVGLNDLLWVVVGTTANPEVDTQKLKDGVPAWCKGGEPMVRAAAAQPSKDDKQGTSDQKNAAPNGDANDQSKDQKPGVQLDASLYALFFNGREVPGLDETVYDSARHAFGFRLARNADNKVLWARLLGSPAHAYREVRVALGVKEKDKTTQPTIVAAAKSRATFNLRIFSWGWFWIATVLVLLALGLVVATAKTTTTLRDCLVPQLPPKEQPYSLARCQMAFWFVLVFASFLFLYIMLWDYNTVSTQALALMGISSATALAAVTVDVLKESPADMANRALQALGLNTYADVLRVNDEIAFRQQQLPVTQTEAKTTKAAADRAKAASDATAANAAATDAEKAEAAKAAKDAADVADAADRALKQLNAEIQDRQIRIRTYQDKSRPFRSENFFKDITTDLNGPTVHRLQVVFWTFALGGVFLVGVYRDLAMSPDFSGTLLALMGLSGAGYVGFKYPEKNN